jgi:tripartite-type tricarboxylate transporter receptor subunit TctC
MTISADVGFPDLIAQQFMGLFAPTGTPWQINEQIAGLTREITADKDFQNKLVRAGFEPVTDYGPQATAKYVHDQLVRWTPLLKASGLRTN